MHYTFLKHLKSSAPEKLLLFDYILTNYTVNFFDFSVGAHTFWTVGKAKGFRPSLNWVECRPKFPLVLTLWIFLSPGF